MKKLALLAASLFSAVTFADPSPNDIYIKDVIAGGPGCPQGTYSAMWTSTNPDSEAANFFEVIYDGFFVQKGAGISITESRKQCTVAVNMNVPNGWQFSIMEVHYDGFADIPVRNMGILQTEYHFPHFSNRVTTTKNIMGPYSNDYSKEDSIGIFSQIWSPCGLEVPLNMKSTLWVRGPKDDAAWMTVDRQTGLLTQKWHVQWRRCTRTR